MRAMIEKNEKQQNLMELGLQCESNRGKKKKNFSEERGLSDERNIFIYLQSGLEARSYK